MSTTFTEAVEAQTKVMLAVAKMLDERGYGIILHKLNHDTKHDQYGYGYVIGGFERFFKEWGRHHDRTPILVHVWVQDGHQSKVWEGGRVFDQPFIFKCTIPNRVRYKPIHATLGLASCRQGTRENGWRVTGVGALLAGNDSNDSTCYAQRDSNNSRDALEILLRTFQMPDHRALLRAPASQRRY